MSNRNIHTVEPVIAGAAQAASAANDSSSRGMRPTRVSSSASPDPTASVATTHAAANPTVCPNTSQNRALPSRAA